MIVELLLPLYDRDPSELAVVDLLARAFLIAENWSDALALIEAAPRKLRNHFRLQLTAGRALAV